MPTEKAHIDKALHNIEVVAYLNGQPDYHDWTATVCFYAALHVVEALFVLDTSIRHGINHEHREQVLKRTKRFEKVYRHYRVLQSAATVARYLNERGDPFKAYLSPAEVCADLVKHHLLQLIRSTLNVGKGLSSTSTESLKGAMSAIGQLDCPGRRT